MKKGEKGPVKKRDGRRRVRSMFDPKQMLFIQYYFDPKSETFSNGMQSALKAGYAPDYAKVITAPSVGLEWVVDAFSEMDLVQKADRNIRHFLDLPEDSDSKLRVKSETTRFVAETLNKKKYSKRTDVDITSNGERIEAINYIVPKKPEEREEV